MDEAPLEGWVDEIMLEPEGPSTSEFPIMAEDVSTLPTFTTPSKGMNSCEDSLLGLFRLEVSMASTVGSWRAQLPTTIYCVILDRMSTKSCKALRPSSSLNRCPQARSWKKLL